MRDSILLILGFVLVNNLALTQFLGLTPLLGFAKRREKVLSLGLCVTGVTLIETILLWLLRTVIPGYWQVLAGVILALALTYLLQVALGKKLGIWLPVIALNSAVLGLALKTLAFDTLLTAILSAVGAGTGFLFGLFLLSGLQDRIHEEKLPKAFRGFPIQILTAAIIALALTAFNFQ